MTIEIKFRAWDIHKEVFIPTDVYGVITTDFNAFGIMLKDWEDYREGEYFYSNSQTLSQYTGLKDKNGIDIYEGDIVIIRFWHNNPPSKRPKIKYVDINLPVVFGNGSFHISDSPRIPQYGTRYGKEFEQCEIIGNIYQHPNLINQ